MRAIHSDTPRVVRDIELTVSEVREVNLSKGKKAFCEVHTNTHLVGITGLQKASSLFWGEKFNISLVPGEDTIKVHLKTEGGILGTVKINIRTLIPNSTTEDWFPLKKHDTLLKSQMRLKINYSQTVVLPTVHYTNIISLLLNTDFVLLRFLARNITSQDRIDLTKVLCDFSIGTKNYTKIIASLVFDEIRATHSLEVLFRGNSVASKTIEHFMKTIAEDWIKALEPSIIKIFNEAQTKSVEINQSKMKDSDNLEKNVEFLKSLVRHTLNAIFESSNLCPKPLRDIFYVVRKTVEKQFCKSSDNLNSLVNTGKKYTSPSPAASLESLPDVNVNHDAFLDVHGGNYENAGYLAVSGILFLRLFVPAIKTPKLFGLLPNFVEGNLDRALTLVASTIQKISNIATFGQHEPYLYLLNDMIMEQIPNFKKFIDTITDPKIVFLNTEIEANIDFFGSCSKILTFFSKEKDYFEQKKTEFPLFASFLEELVRIEERVKDIESILKQELLPPLSQDSDPPQKSRVGKKKRNRASSAVDKGTPFPPLKPQPNNNSKVTIPKTKDHNKKPGRTISKNIMKLHETTKKSKTSLENLDAAISNDDIIISFPLHLTDTPNTTPQKSRPKRSTSSTSNRMKVIPKSKSSVDIPQIDAVEVSIPIQTNPTRTTVQTSRSYSSPNSDLPVPSRSLSPHSGSSSPIPKITDFEEPTTPLVNSNSSASPSIPPRQRVSMRNSRNELKNDQLDKLQHDRKFLTASDSGGRASRIALMRKQAKPNYYELYNMLNGNPICFVCKGDITDAKPLFCLEKYFHSECFKCGRCMSWMGGMSFYTVDNQLYCSRCFMIVQSS